MKRKILMHMGPSVGNYKVTLAGVTENVGFASPEFIAAMKESLEGVAEVMGAGSDHMPFIIPGSGTAAMESAVTFLRRGDRVLVLSNGVFGDRWLRIFERYPVKVDYLNARAGETVLPEDAGKFASVNKYRLTVMTHVETSTGVRSPVHELIHSVRASSDIVAVDGVASVGGENVSAKEWDADIVLTASQKAIGAPPGLGLLVVRKSLLGVDGNDRISGFFLDLNNWAPVMQGMLDMKGGYFATPPISTIFSLREAFRLAREEGLSKRIERHASAAGEIRSGVQELGLGIVAMDGLRSNTVTGVRLDGIDAAEFVKKCADRGVEFATGVHPELKGKYFRIGHMGWVTDLDVTAALEVIKQVLHEMR